MTGWLLVAAGMALSVLLLWWVDASQKRLAAIATALFAVIIGLGFHWEPAPGALLTLANASQSVAAAPARLGCAQAQQAAALVKDMGKDLLVIDAAGAIRVATPTWLALGENEKGTLAAIAAGTRRCVRGAVVKDVEILDSSSGALIERRPVAE